MLPQVRSARKRNSSTFARSIGTPARSDQPHPGPVVPLLPPQCALRRARAPVPGRAVAGRSRSRVASSSGAACRGVAQRRLQNDSRVCRGLSLCERGHAVFHENQWWNVYCFAKPGHADKFMQRFGGEKFDPKQKGRGSNWARWGERCRRPMAAIHNVLGVRSMSAITPQAEIRWCGLQVR